MRAFIVLVSLAAGVAAALVAALVLFFRGGISARPSPSALETWLAGEGRQLALLPVRDLRNPVAASAEVLDEARAHFADHCAVCHANDGSGETAMGAHLYPRAPDLRGAGTQRLTDGELFTIIENGVRFTGMPAWGDQGAESQRASWMLVHFIRHLPQLTPQERLQMRSLNPKAPDDRAEEREDQRFLEGDGKAVPVGPAPHHQH